MKSLARHNQMPRGSGGSRSCVVGEENLFQKSPLAERSSGRWALSIFEHLPLDVSDKTRVRSRLTTRFWAELIRSKHMEEIRPTMLTETKNSAFQAFWSFLHLTLPIGVSSDRRLKAFGGFQCPTRLKLRDA